MKIHVKFMSRLLDKNPEKIAKEINKKPEIVRIVMLRDYRKAYHYFKRSALFCDKVTKRIKLK
jgi:hypothetical protein